MDNPIGEKAAQLADEIKAKLHNARTGIIGGEAKERTLARMDELIGLVSGAE